MGISMITSPPGLSVGGLGVGAGDGSLKVDGPGLTVLGLFDPQGFPMSLTGLVVVGSAKLADGGGITTTGGGSGIGATEADGTVVASDGSMLDWTTKNTIPPTAKTNSTRTIPRVRRLREPSSSGGAEILSLRATVGEDVDGTAGAC